jgi:hypothetical protein
MAPRARFADCIENSSRLFTIPLPFATSPSAGCTRQTNRYNVASSDHVQGDDARIFPGKRKGWSMEKWLCWSSLGVSGVLLLLFLLDLFIGIPFGGIDWLVNVFGILACGLVGYLAWESFKELR